MRCAAVPPFDQKHVFGGLRLVSLGLGPEPLHSAEFSLEIATK